MLRNRVGSNDLASLLYSRSSADIITSRTFEEKYYLATLAFETNDEHQGRSYQNGVRYNACM
jgi:hypothetical protein